MRPQISVLDLSPIPSGSTARQALLNTIDLARHAESIGLTRFWLAEHHNAAALASSSPEIMIAAVAAATARIRVGSGGIMLPNHSPLKVAETFRVLAALHPERIDLGVGRAPGTDKNTALVLRQSKELLGTEAFPAQLDDLLTYLTRDPEDRAARFGPIKAVPIGVPAPPVFLLGSGLEGATMAAHLGLGFAHAFHISPDNYVDAMRTYRKEFRPSLRPHFTKPYAILAASVICAEDDSKVEDLARCSDLGVLRFGQGQRDLPMPSVEEARAYVFDEEEDTLRLHARARHVMGGPSRVADALRKMIEESQADELMAMTGIHDHSERKRSYDRLVRALD